MSGSLVKNLGIIGLGLIGGSFARSLKSARMVEKILGFDLRAGEIELAAHLGIIDEACQDLPELATKSQVIVLATPVKAIEPVLRVLAPYLTKDHILTDMGSVKAAVVSAIYRVFGGPLPGFVPGHPIAGSEKSGVAAAVTDLFVDHKTILTPLPETSPEALDIVTRLWRASGAKVLMMAPEHHDEVLAATSHLPHLIAFSLVDTLAGAENNKDIFRYAAGGFRDFTRIAASDPVMWHDIYLSNRQAVLKAVDEFNKGLNKLRLAIAQGDGEALLGVFTRARSAREHFGNMLEGKGYVPEGVVAGQSCKVTGGTVLSGSIRLFGDKFIAHRAIIIAVLAKGISRIQGFPECETTLATLQAFRDMGAVIEGPDRGEVIIHGVGLFGLTPPAGPLYVGHSQPSMSLLLAIMVGQSFSCEIMSEVRSSDLGPVASFAGASDAVLELVKVLRESGAEIEFSGNGKPLLVVKGSRKLSGCDYHLQESDSELKTCLLLAALYAEGRTTIKENGLTHDHTERLLSEFGYPVQHTHHQIRLHGRQQMAANIEVDIPVDFTLAFYFLVAASITSGSELELQHVGINDRRSRALSVLKSMGAAIEVLNSRKVANEWVAGIRTRAVRLSGYVMTAEHCVQANEELPALLVVACFAGSPSRITELSRLPRKVRELLDQTVELMVRFGGDFSYQGDDLVVNIREQHSIDVTTESPEHPGMVLASIVFAHAVGGHLTLTNCSEFFLFYPGITEVSSKIGLNIKLAG